MRNLGPIENLTCRIAEGLRALRDTNLYSSLNTTKMSEVAEFIVAVSEVILAVRNIKIDMSNELLIRYDYARHKLKETGNAKAANEELALLDWVYEYWGGALQFKLDECDRAHKRAYAKLDELTAARAS